MAGRERGRDLIVIGGSAGSLEPLRKLVAGLPADLPAAILVVIHIFQRLSSYLQQISGTPVAPHDRSEREAKARARSNYVAPPDRHLLVERRLRGS